MDARWLPAFDELTDPAPHGRLLSNGRYAVLLTSAGTGVSAWSGVQLTAWDGDRTEDGAGWFLYLRDRDDRRAWSAGYQPVVAAGGDYAARYTAGVITLERAVGEIASTLEVCVDPHADAEVRRLTLTNRSARPRCIEVTSYCEVVLNAAAAHAGHPAFSKLFVETEFVADADTLLARRRPRSHGEGAPCMAAALIGDGELQYETDRARFLGRNRELSAPHAFDATAPLAGRTGSVLDPVFALRRSVSLAPGRSGTVHAILAAGEDRAGARAALAKAAAAEALATVADRARAADRDLLAELGIAPRLAEAYQELGAAIRYGHPALRAGADTLARARGSMADVCQFGLGGRPFAVIVAEAESAAPRIDELLAAQAYWLRCGTRIDLVILCGPGVSDAAMEALGRRQPAGATVAVRHRDALPAATVDVLLAAAAYVSSGPLPSLGGRRSVGAVLPTGRGPDEAAPSAASPPADGFSADGTEYVIQIDGARRPPLAWINVIANEGFGFLTSETGAAFTWSRNSHEHRLTPWSNDALRDPHGEALYIRDADSGACWSPQPGPAPGPGPYEVRHGFGATVWRHASRGLDQEVTAFVPRRDPMRIVRLRLTNRGTARRRLSICSYQRLVVGVTPNESARFVVTEYDRRGPLLVARNGVNGELSGGAVFAAAACGDGAAQLAYTTDRAAFIGRNGTAAAPAALRGTARLDSRVGAALDPCFALQWTFELEPGASFDCAFLLGDASDRDAAARLVERHRRLAEVDAALADVRAFWRETLGAVQIETPEPAIDRMVNGWLLYQALSCRLWGRSALYQSGGAFGFRDQLQDSAALVYAHPELTRAQILLHAAHQFIEGDVLHWWHPPASRGTRTRFSDDLLWLPYVACFYAHATGDWRVFDEQADFMTAPPLAPGEDEAYLLPAAANAPASLFEHCCRAVDRSLTRGPHGLPLMGTGDWNDGMNRVGREGRGESMFVGFFLYALLGDFIGLCERRGETARARHYGEYRGALRDALNGPGWDGGWYRRAYFDDGAPLGSAANDECQIDALAQAWAVISSAAPPERAARAMEAVDARLVDREAGLIKLLTPPFDRGRHDPGYIKGYVPGIRENGGQYTHAAMWTIRAFAELGRRDRAAAYLGMLSPVAHARDREEVYRVEPYVVAADVYGVAPHVGRGGWTWYTGSAAWMFRVALESILGVQLEAGTRLVIRPRIPDAWPGYRVRLRLPGRTTRVEIVVENPDRCADTVRSAELNGASATVADACARIAVPDDGAAHLVKVTLGAAAGGHAQN